MRALSGPAVPPTARPRGPPDAQLWRHGLVSGQRRVRGSQANSAEHEAVLAGREPGRGRVADRAPRRDDPRQRSQLAPCRARQPHTIERGYRRLRRPHKRPGHSYGILTRSNIQSPEAVAGVALLGYLLVFYIFFNHYQDLRGFIWIGKNYIEKSQVSPDIRPDPDFTYQLGGYDGQFAYFLALDPVNAHYYMDRDSYR